MVLAGRAWSLGFESPRESMGGEVKNSQTAPESGGSLGAASFDELVVIIKNLTISQQVWQVENKVLDDERASVASYQELHEIESQLLNGAQVLEANQQQQATFNQQQELRNMQQDKYNADVNDAVRELTAEIRKMREENMVLRNKVGQLENELAKTAGNKGKYPARNLHVDTNYQEQGVLGEEGLSISQQNHQAEMTLLAKENSERISALEKELVALEPAVADRFKVVEEKVLDDERASVASFQEIKEIEAQLRNGAMVLEAKQNEQQEFNQQQATLNQQQELRNQQQDKYNADVSDEMKELLAEVKNMREENLRLKEKTERLERELALQQLRSSQLEKQRERVVSSLGLQVNTSTWPVPDNPTENIPQVQAPFNNRQGSRYLQTPNTVKSPEDVEMTDATPPDYDQVVPEFDGKNMENKRGIEEEFYSERDIEDVKNQILKLRHNWGQAYEYLSEFNKYSRILNLSEETKKLVLSWQVKPSKEKRSTTYHKKKGPWKDTSNA
ncbi:hypothetical protein PIROE2DRAFT_65479 [Piromyces sp. E2]|nr:hypothetical protein PIROE2DRAFT_65479 [Piromyces sp. E2]|eukprot:OUM56544.1 hypothetical protein PIROE2DRAFT_65479 [Piromyces sp. E2]